VETQGAFAQRVATEFGRRYDKQVEVELEKQMTFSEPLVRINNEPKMLSTETWSEDRFWDMTVDYWMANSD
jgi:hypothetical protein